MASIRDACRQTFIVTIAAGLLTSCSGLQLPWDDSKAPAPPTNVEQRTAEIPPPAGGLAAVRLRVAETALKSHDNETAERLYREAHEADPKAATPLIGLGEAEYAQHHYDEAATAFRDALARAPNNPAIMEGLAKSLISKGSYDEARSLLEAAVKTVPNASLLNKLGVARDLSGDGPGAQAAYRAALTLDPDNLSMRNNLALSLAISGQHKEAIAEMEKVAADPRAGGRYNGNLAFVYGLAGNLQAAERIGGTAENAAESSRLKAQYDEIRALAGKGDRAAVLAMLTDKVRPQTTQASTAEPAVAPKAEVAGASKGEVAAASSPEETAAPKTEVAAAPTAEPSPAAKFDASATIAAKVAETVEAKTEAEAVPPEADQPAKPAKTVASAEAKPAPEPTPVASAAPEAQQPAKSTKAASVDAKPASDPAPVASAPAEVRKPAEGPKVASLEKPEAKPTTSRAEAKTVFGGWQVQLAAYRTSKQADRGWAMLVEKAGDMLHGLYKLERHDTGRTGASRINYRLRTHALPEKAKAAALCNMLHEREIDCLVVHQVTGVWVASAKTATTKVASVSKTAGSASAGTSEASAGKAAGHVQPSAGQPTDNGWRVQLAAYRTLAAAERGRKLLTSKAAALLPELHALQRVGGSHGNGIDFRLRTAELPGKAAATDICKKLQTQGVECLVIRQLPDRWIGAEAG